MRLKLFSFFIKFESGQYNSQVSVEGVCEIDNCSRSSRQVKPVYL